VSGAWLAIDGGQSASRVRASWRDDVLEGTGFVHGPDRVAMMAAALEPALRQLDPLPALDVVVAGHTGLPVGEPERTELARLLARRTGARRIVLAADWATAHAGAFAGGPGVVVAAGTGAVALGVAADGAARKIDGVGHLFGDAGGGWWIGRAALEEVLRDADGRAVAPALAEAARARFGADLRAAAWELYATAHVVDAVARFAPDVIALAGGGDEPAARIVARAAGELATSAAAAARHLPVPVPVAVTGRLLDPAGALGRDFHTALDSTLPGAALHPAAGGPLDGAVAIAAHGAGIHASLLHTYQEPA
jgi:N-acetylglucosamine kinase-like BadF-type ATPase